MANIPAATIDANPVAVGDAVVLTGYGCESGLAQQSYDPVGPRLKLDSATALPAASGV